MFFPGLFKPQFRSLLVRLVNSVVKIFMSFATFYDMVGNVRFDLASFALK